MIDQYPPANGVLTSLIWRKTAAGGETSLSGYDNASQALSYTPGQEQVYLNGILLVRGDDYTATNGTSITGLTALAAGDFVQINCYNNFSVASVPATSITGTIANDKLTNSSITINGSPVSLGGSVSLAGDIEGVTAGIGISGGGTSGTVTITNDMATTISAKGDLVVGTANDAYTALTVGANNTVLTADSSTATGLKWATPASPSSNWTLVTSGSVTTGTSVSLSVGGYDRYIVHFNIYIAGTPTVKWRFNNLSSSNYRYAAGLSGAWTTQTDVDGINLDNFSTWSDQPNGFLEINNANSSGKPQFFGSWKRTDSTGDNRRAYLINYSGLYNANINLTSIDLVSTSTIGEFAYRVWGL